ncbi:hypothetical protein [Siphonobacter sp. SORGH_AS_0500]|uniref:hypothetical protein n=1 Tax=Siphonobacter sp. SORGH_AS_0500 TaxID=1864824 RepID=UPI00286B7477|nr:hypothetical protein [Siphonobacter sp. SORGH_AS_0500]
MSLITMCLRKAYIPLFLLPFASSVLAQKQLPEKTSMQIDRPWSAAYDIRSDIAMLYTMDSTFNYRAQSWREKGYNLQFMTGVSWGNYQDYFHGTFDGKTHEDDVQTDREGKPILHGVDVPYIVPTESYISYLKAQVKKAIDQGVSALYLEEPEFWAQGGYSPSFKKEWQAYYQTPWQAQHESPEATYLSSKLKYHLYYRALQQVFLYAKEYSESKGTRIKCYVPTHSLLNYSAWQIVSPEASLASLPGMDGYIAQVWTGTSRVPNYFNGVKKERVFENAFLEYSSVVSMTAPTKKTVYFLTDPIEDGTRSWDDYKRNYEATFTAELMFPSVDHFEVMPWPHRIYLGKYQVGDNPEPQSISPAYATQMQVMINSLNDMPASTNKVTGSQGVSVLLGNSMMFQRFPTHQGYEDPQLSNFYGMALPLFKRGIPVDLVHMENLSYPEALQGTKVLIMSYANMKPFAASVHEKLAEWVKGGGVLVYYGRDTDAFQHVREWWNTGDNQYKTPLEHLLKLMNVPVTTNDASYTYGKGKVFITKVDPKELAMQPGRDEAFIQQIQQAYEGEAKAGTLRFKNSYQLDRGPYTLAAVMDEHPDKTPLTIPGPVIDLYDPSLPVLASKVVQPDQQAFVYRLKGISKKPQVLAAASRVYDFKVGSKFVSFLTKSPSQTNNVMRISLPKKPQTITVLHQKKALPFEQNWDEATHTLLLKFENFSEGVMVEIKY